MGKPLYVIGLGKKDGLIYEPINAIKNPKLIVNNP